ncbi:MAG: AMP-binding protein [Pirellulaceae bacterium]|nr:AMP-binding protein [Pirellulaceae bacterium]
MLFLISPTGDVQFGYDRLLDDLIRGTALVPSGDATSDLYAELVYWLGSILRCRPEVRWNGTVSRDLAENHRDELPEKTRKALESANFSNPQSNLAPWREPFLRSTSRILLETSGSSGHPKRVWHSMQSLTRGAKLSAKHRSAVWGLTYPTDHLAGIQVLFQAILNRNPLVNLYRASAADVHRALQRWKITHVSCTPTFLRMLLYDTYVHPHLERLTTGGERLDAQLLEPIARMFPHARLTNIYASTEVGSLLVSHNDGFVIGDQLLDRVRIVDGQLYLHDSLKVDSHDEYDFAIEPSGSTSQMDGFWATGDQVEIIHDQPLTIRFLARSHEGFNVAGFRVDPVRLEAIARTHPQVADARFYGIPNSVTEHLVACDLVPVQGGQPPEVSQWQDWFRPQVARHEVPRVVRWVRALDTTDSGKVKRS